MAAPYEESPVDQLLVQVFQPKYVVFCTANRRIATAAPCTEKLIPHTLYANKKFVAKLITYFLTIKVLLLSPDALGKQHAADEQVFCVLSCICLTPSR